MIPSAQLVAIRREVKRLVEAAHQCLEKELRTALAEEGIHVVPYHELNAKQLQACKHYFSEIIFPVLTPLAFDPGRPFPHISNLSLNLAVLIHDAGGDERFARVKVPDSLPALVPLTRMHSPSHKRSRTRRQESYVWIEEVIAANLDALFPGMKIVEVHPFHVTRDADIAIKELEAEDLLETIEEGVRQRKFGSVVRLQVNQEMPQHILQILKINLELESGEVYRGKGLLGLSRLFALAQIDRPDLKYKPFLPTSPPELKPTSDEEDMFTLIRRRDILLHHPFQSFQPVVDFLRQAARDPDVLREGHRIAVGPHDPGAGGEVFRRELGGDLSHLCGGAGGGGGGRRRFARRGEEERASGGHAALLPGAAFERLRPDDGRRDFLLRRRGSERERGHSAVSERTLRYRY